MLFKIFITLTIIISNFMIIVQTQAKAVDIGVTIDFLDTAFFTKRSDYISKKELRERMRKLADMGIKKFYFRAAPGVAYYPSKVLRMFAGDGRKEEWDRKLIKSVNKYDVLGEYIRVCKELGIKCYYWEPIFDNEISPVHYQPDSEKGKKFGEYPLGDIYFQKNRNLYMKHRYADALSKKYMLKRPIKKIKLFSSLTRKPRLKKEDIKIYTGNKKNIPALKLYKKDFNFSVKKEKGKYVLIFDNLNIKSKMIKIKQNLKDKKFTVILNLNQPGWYELYDSQGKIKNLTVQGETTYKDDITPCKTTSGTGAVRTAWDYMGRSLIIHIGDFDKYAGGMPCYALRKARDRRLAIAKEILTNYPDIAGIAYSLRTHSKRNGYNLDFGFNPPIVKEYKKRYNVDILKQDFDHEKFMSIRGDFFSEFIKEVAQLIHSHGKKFEVQAVPDSTKINYGYTTSKLFKEYNINNFFQIRKWATKAYVDTVMIVSDTQKWDSRWENQIKDFHDCLKNTKTKLAFMFMVRGKKTLPFVEKVAENEFIDEIVLYEEEVIFGHGLYDMISGLIKQANKARTKNPVK